jgi:hypothetical protein
LSGSGIGIVCNTPSNIALNSSFSKQTTLHGLGGNDTLTGGAKNDTLIGGAGDDTLTGAGYSSTKLPLVINSFSKSVVKTVFVITMVTRLLSAPVPSWSIVSLALAPFMVLKTQAMIPLLTSH